MASDPKHIESWKFSAAPNDPLASALALALTAKGHATSAEILRAGMPLPRDGKMTPALAVRAVEERGLRCALVRRKLSDIPRSALPAVVFLEGRDAAVLVSIGETSCLLDWPSRSDAPIEVPLEEFGQVYFGHLLVLAEVSTLTQAGQPQSGDEQAANNGHWFWGSVWRFKSDYAQVVLATALINVLALAIPIFTMNVYDRVFPTAAMITLWSLVAGVGLALVFDMGLKFLRAAMIDSVGRRVDAAVSSRIFRQITGLELSGRGPSETGALLNTLKDYETLRDAFSSQTVATLTDLVFSFIFVGVIWIIAGPLAYPPAAVLIAVLLAGCLIVRPLRHASNAVQATGAARNAVAVEALSDPETLTAIAGQGRMQARWETQVAQAAAAQERSRKLATRATTFTAFGQQASSVAIVVTGVFLALDGQITMGAVIAAMILSGRALGPTAALAGTFVRLSFAGSTLRALNEIMRRPSQARSQQQPMVAPLTDVSLRANDASFTYAGSDRAAINNVSLDVPAGGALAIVGAVGSGKTTLVRLLSGLVAPTAGMVEIDHRNMAQVPSDLLRHSIQFVPQDPVLFTGTLAENIAFGHPQASSEDILRVSRLTGVDRLAAGHAEGFGMQIGERGRNLSGGERQMIALARALLAAPRVLVLDEPSSAMDNRNEAMLVRRLSHVLAQTGASLIVATHRMGLLELVDTVAVMDRGKLAEFGPKQDVLAKLREAEAGQGNPSKKTKVSVSKRVKPTQHADTSPSSQSRGSNP